MGWLFGAWGSPGDGLTALDMARDSIVANSKKSGNSTSYGFRYGQWKLVKGSVSCDNADCDRPMLFNLATDLGERNDVSVQNPEIFAAIQRNFTQWYASVAASIVNESMCNAPSPTPPAPPVPPAPPSSDCKFESGMALSGRDPTFKINTASKEACCGACIAHASRCAAAAYHRDGLCVGRARYSVKPDGDTGDFICIKSDTSIEAAQQHDADWVVDEQ